MDLEVLCDEIFGESRMNGGPIKWDNGGGDIFTSEFLGEGQRGDETMNLGQLVDAIFGESRMNGGPIKWDNGGGDIFASEFLGE